ncbi:hypothetical protein GN156_11790 [bacterium LRH843]|nr:hypothetical protein [bacterium LRH843]
MGLLLHFANTEYISPSPKIEKFYTSIPEKDNWVTVPKDTKELTIYVEPTYTETVLFWLIPTGTTTWNERKLIGYDTNHDGDNKFTLSRKVPKHLLNHLEIQALGENEIADSLLNIYKK